VSFQQSAARPLVVLQWLHCADPVFQLLLGVRHVQAPIQIADDLKKYGGYIPGVRPGEPTPSFLISS